MTRGRMYVIALIALVVFLAVNNALMAPHKQATVPPAATAENAPASREAAPDIKMPLEPGKPPVSLSSMKGKVVLLDFWATWCGPCKESIPELEKLYKKYHDKGLEVIGISVDDSIDPVPQAVRELGMTYPVVLARDIPDIRSKFEFEAIPQMFLVDKQGKKGEAFRGYDPSRDLEPTIKKYLDE